MGVGCCWLRRHKAAILYINGVWRRCEAPKANHGKMGWRLGIKPLFVTNRYIPIFLVKRKKPGDPAGLVREESFRKQLGGVQPWSVNLLLFQCGLRLFFSPRSDMVLTRA
jgi:hypothetical protein